MCLSGADFFIAGVDGCRQRRDFHDVDDKRQTTLRLAPDPDVTAAAAVTSPVCINLTLLSLLLADTLALTLPSS